MSLTLQSVDPARRDELALADERVAYSWNALDPVLNHAANALAGLPFPQERRVAVFAQNLGRALLHFSTFLALPEASAPIVARAAATFVNLLILYLFSLSCQVGVAT